MLSWIRARAHRRSSCTEGMEDLANDDERHVNEVRFHPAQPAQKGSSYVRLAAWRHKLATRPTRLASRRFYRGGEPFDRRSVVSPSILLQALEQMHGDDFQAVVALPPSPTGWSWPKVTWCETDYELLLMLTYDQIVAQKRSVQVEVLL